MGEGGSAPPSLRRPACCACGGNQQQKNTLKKHPQTSPFPASQPPRIKQHNLQTNHPSTQPPSLHRNHILFFFFFCPPPPSAHGRVDWAAAGRAIVVTDDPTGARHGPAAADPAAPGPTHDGTGRAPNRQRLVAAACGNGNCVRLARTEAVLHSRLAWCCSTSAASRLFNDAHGPVGRRRVLGVHSPLCVPLGLKKKTNAGRGGGLAETSSRCSPWASGTRNARHPVNCLAAQVGGRNLLLQGPLNFTAPTSSFSDVLRWASRCTPTNGPRAGPEAAAARRQTPRLSRGQAHARGTSLQRRRKSASAARLGWPKKTLEVRGRHCAPAHPRATSFPPPPMLVLPAEGTGPAGPGGAGRGLRGRWCDGENRPGARPHSARGVSSDAASAPGLIGTPATSSFTLRLPADREWREGVPQGRCRWP